MRTRTMLLVSLGLAWPLHVLAVGGQLSALNGICRKSIDSGDFDEAARLCRRVNFDAEKLAPGSVEHVTSLINLGDLKQKIENFVDADGYYASAFDYVQKRDKDSLEAAHLLELQAESKIGRGKFLDAEPLLRHAVIIREKRSGALAIDVAKTRAREADVLALMTQYLDAHYAYRRAIAVFQRGGSATRADYLLTQRHLAEMMERQSRFEQAQIEYRQLLVAAQATPMVPASVIVALDRLGWIAAQDGRRAEATEFYRQEIGVLRSSSANGEAITAVEAQIASLKALPPAL